VIKDVWWCNNVLSLVCFGTSLTAGQDVARQVSCLPWSLDYFRKQLKLEAEYSTCDKVGLGHDFQSIVRLSQDKLKIRR